MPPEHFWKLEHGLVILLPRYKDHLAIKTTFAYSHRWSLYQGSTVVGTDYRMLIDHEHCLITDRRGPWNSHAPVFFKRQTDQVGKHSAATNRQATNSRVDGKQTPCYPVDIYANVSFKQ